MKMHGTGGSLQGAGRKAAVPTLSARDLALAELIIGKLRVLQLQAVPDLGREEAAHYCGLSLRAWDRECRRYPRLLKPCKPTRPLRWWVSTLDIYRTLRGDTQALINEDRKRAA